MTRPQSQASNPAPPLDPRQRGVVMVITLLGMLLLIALVTFIINLGGQVNRRIEAQNLADTTAHSAATWTARSMNLVAQNNVKMARTIALINVLDAMPQAAFNVENETRAFHDRLQEQLTSGGGIDAGHTELRDEVEGRYEVMLAELGQTLNEVEPVAALFDQIDVRDLTHYQRDGLLWRELRAMDQLNQSLVANIGDVSQHAADRMGQLGGSEGAEPRQVAVLPLQPQLPVQRGEFDDFLRPVVNGLLPEDIDDRVTNRGPWDTVFGWRSLRSQRQGGQFVPSENSVATGGRGNTPASGGVGPSGGRWVGGETVVTGYSTYGPRTWLLRRVSNFNHDHMPHTRLSMWVREISEIKLKRLWPSVSIQYGHFHNTEWITSYEEAKQLATEYHNTRRLPRVLQTAYFVLEIKSKYPIDDPNFMDDGTWQIVDRHNHPEPRVVYLAPQNGPNHGTGHGPWAGWYDAATWGITELNEYAWRDDWSYEVFWDNDIDIERETQTVTGPDGESDEEPVPQTVYRYDFFVFAGANIDWDKRPENPWDGFDRNAPDAPSPMNLDHTVMTPGNLRARFEHLKFLAMAWYSDDPQAWPARFGGGDRPSPGVMAMAQAKVFNNHSWDLWTQMWHAKLEPISNANGTTGIDDWIASMDGDEVPPTMSEDGADTLQALLESMADMAPAALAH